MGVFAASVSEFADLSQKALLAVFRGSAQDVAEQVRVAKGKGGRMPVDTGFLRASLMASTATMPTIDRNSRPPENAVPNSFFPDNTQILAVIAAAELRDTIYLGFTAGYADYQENLNLFAETAFLTWPATVAHNVEKARTAYGL